MNPFRPLRALWFFIKLGIGIAIGVVIDRRVGEHVNMWYLINYIVPIGIVFSLGTYLNGIGNAGDKDFEKAREQFDIGNQTWRIYGHDLGRDLIGTIYSYKGLASIVIKILFGWILGPVFMVYEFYHIFETESGKRTTGGNILMSLTGAALIAALLIGTQQAGAIREMFTPFASRNSPVLTESNAEIGNHVSFGYYEQDGNDGNGPESVSWTIIDRRTSGTNIRVLLLADDLLFVDSLSGFPRHETQYSDHMFTDAEKAAVLVRIDGSMLFLIKSTDTYPFEPDARPTKALRISIKEHYDNDLSKVPPRIAYWFADGYAYNPKGREGNEYRIRKMEFEYNDYGIRPAVWVNADRLGN